MLSIAKKYPVHQKDIWHQSEKIKISHSNSIKKYKIKKGLTRLSYVTQYSASE